MRVWFLLFSFLIGFSVSVGCSDSENESPSSLGVQAHPKPKPMVSSVPPSSLLQEPLAVPPSSLLQEPLAVNIQATGKVGKEGEEVIVTIHNVSTFPFQGKVLAKAFDYRDELLLYEKIPIEILKQGEEIHRSFWIVPAFSYSSYEIMPNASSTASK